MTAKDFFKLNNLWFWLAMIGTVGIIAFAILSYQGRDFPTEEQLHYNTGILTTHDLQGKRRGNTVALITDDNKKMIFTCDYSAFHSSITERCMSFRHYKKYLNKPATIGWYNPKEFFGFSNPYPQLVTLTVEGKPIRDGEEEIFTYNYTVNNKIQVMNRYSPILYFVVWIIWVGGLVLLQWSEERDKKYLEEKEQEQ